MKNRDRYIVKVNEFDMLSAINAEIMGGMKCVIEAMTGEYQYGENKERCIASSDRDCDECIRNWLNEEA